MLLSSHKNLGVTRNDKKSRLSCRRHCRKGKEELKNMPKLQIELQKGMQEGKKAIELFERIKNGKCSKSAICTFCLLAVTHCIPLSGIILIKRSVCSGLCLHAHKRLPLKLKRNTYDYLYLIRARIARSLSRIVHPQGALMY